jgi:DNA-binding helix-hairpin-helix protein with protein kinase domain
MSEENKSYTALYADGHNEKITLGALLNKGGAAGSIYEDTSHPGSVAKIFHDKEHSDTNRQKLQAMLHNRPDIPNRVHNGVEYIQIAWPTALLEDELGYCVGYLMPLIDTKQAISLEHLIQKAVRKKLGISDKYINRLYAAYNLTSVVAALHACGHYIVDLKPANVSIYKKTMLIAMFDCDGFSIRGENDARYPAEFVSEEYIYPEGMKQTCAEMGEEQDKFALAVIIFKLLNEGIHPFSGMPRKNEDMLSIQERIADYHYAYGIWPDTYQAPHPYSIHDYFDKTTMNLFERAFNKGSERPSAIEWQEHLDYLIAHRKQCKKDRNHIYFTPKGCGLCMVAEKFRIQLDNYKKEIEKPQTVHGLDLKSLQNANLTKKEQMKKIKNYVSYGLLITYLLFFAFSYKLAGIFKEPIVNAGIFTQFALITCGIIAINKLLKIIEPVIPEAKKQNIISMLKIYAYICLIIAFISLGSFTFEFFSLAE